MANVMNFVVENWVWFTIAGIILLPAFIWQMLCSLVFGSVIGFQGDKYGEEPYKYGVFWEECVRQGGHTRSGWRMISENKFSRAVNLLSFYWLWGYILLLLAYAAGTIVRWIGQGLSWCFKGLWRLISAVYNAI